MRLIRNWAPCALILTVATMNGGCILVPEIKDRIVELAVGGSTTVPFVSAGSGGTLNETYPPVNILDGFNLAQILDDAGIDVPSVTNIKLSGVDYQITVEDREPTREITNGAITISRNGSGALPLVSNFSIAAGAKSDWQPAPLDPSGAAVSDINAMLQAILDALKLGTSPPSNLTTITYHVTGNSSPPNGYNFGWELKLKITITGTVKVSVPT